MKNIFKKFVINFHYIDFNIILIIFSAFALRLFLANFGTLQLDHGTFVAWSNSLVQNGLNNFYSGWSDYLPGYLYILWLLGKLNLIPAFQVILFKLPAILADMGTGYLIYKIANNLSVKKWGIILSLIYLFNPAVFANSSLWGQVDSLTAFFSLLAVYLASKNKKVFSAIILAIGTLIKPQAAFILPGILYLIIKNKWKGKEIIFFIISGLVVFIFGFIPFNNTSNIFEFILKRLSVSASQYPYGSVNAFSFWGLFDFWKPDNISFWIGAGISCLLIVIVLFLLRKKGGLEYTISAISLLVSFLFLTRMHERHLLPILAPLLLASLANPVVLVVYAGFSFTYLANLSYSYYWITDNFKEIFNPVIIKFFIITNLSLLLFFIISQFKKIKFSFKYEDLFRLKLNKVKSQINYFGKDISGKKARILLLGILFFSIITRIYSLNLPKEKYFDEVYHAFTAGLVLHGDPKAWEWWNPHPEGFAYEWTHPPVAKLGMTLGMIIFGENAFGWRIVQAILGVGSVLLVYLIASLVFKDRLVGILSSAIFSLDGLVLVMSRIGMNDSYLLFFSLLSILLFLKDKNFLSSVVFGLAIASKWSAIYTLPIFFVSHFVFKKKLKISYLSFLIIPIAIYIASYGIMFKTGHSWENFIEVQKQMWWYHTKLRAEHPYTSPAYTWPMLVRPIYLYNGPETKEFVSRIYAFGNPAVFWFGLFSIILSFFISAKERNKKLGFIIFSYLIFFVPWIASPRIMFLYHYLPSIPFLTIATGFILRRFPKTIIPIFTITLLLFIYFYPHWIGLKIPEWLDRSYYWFPSWR